MITRVALLVAFAAAALSGQQDPGSTGPAVGESIPEFSAVDQSGRRQSLDSLKGPNGLLLLFHRSADW